MKRQSLITRPGVWIGIVTLAGVVALLVLAEMLGWRAALVDNDAATRAGSAAQHDHAGHDHEHDHDHDHESDDHDHEGHAHDHPGHEEASALELSELARKNIGLTTGVVKLQTFVKTVSTPAMAVERPGRSQIQVSAPMTGVVTRIYPVPGEAVQPEQPLFDLRLTHEDLVTAQRDFLRLAEELEVVKREVQRLESAGEGFIAGSRVLQEKYSQQKTEAALHAQRQGLLLHGLTEEQIDQIQQTRTLLQSLTVAAPPFTADDDHQDDIEHLYHVQSISVQRGEHVAAGSTLGVLADHCLLYVEGQAFEDDAERLTRAARDGRGLEVVRPSGGQDGDETEVLEVVYVADQVDRDSRALRFYLMLPNKLVRDQREGEHRFVAWEHRPGQRMEVQIPLGEPWRDQIVLPPEAVVEEGVEAFVFQQNRDHFDRKAVHVIYRDKNAVVVENDPKLLGSTIALAGAYQMQLALKNKSGGGIDPHAGHQH